MRSPFPGMDPYLEGRLWPDLHNRLVIAICDELATVIPDRYSVRTEWRIVEENLDVDQIAVMYPDILVSHALDMPAETGGTRAATLTPPRTYPITAAQSVRVSSVRIREARTRNLVTSMEIVSPVNKRGDGFQQFANKWKRLHQAGVHLIEIDLVRGGTRILPYPDARNAHYLITVRRAEDSRTGAWPFSVRADLPTIPVPLLAGDPDATLELQRLFKGVCLRANYARDIDYSLDPPAPAFIDDDRAWMRERIAAAAPG